MASGDRWLSRLVEVLSRPLGDRAAPSTADAIVVLGSPLREDGTLGRVGEERVRAGAAMWHTGLAPVVVATGGRAPGVPATRPPEAEVMGRRLVELGVARDALRVEAESTNTRENGLRTAELLAPEGRRRVWVVTQPFHLRRAMFWFRRAGLDPMGWHIDDSLQYTEPRTGLRWVLREYVAWGRLVAIEARVRVREPL